MILDILNCSRVRLESSTQFYQSNAEFVKVLMNIRSMLESRNEFIEMSYHSLSRLCGDRISVVSMNKYFNSGFILGYSSDESFRCYGNSDIIFQNNDKFEFKIPKLYVSSTPKSLFDKFLVAREYYVYLHYVDGIPSYVGKGIKNRINTSRENLIKTHRLQDRDVKSIKIASNLTERDAFQLEEAYMKAVYMSDGNLLNSAMSKDLAKEVLEKQNAQSDIELDYYSKVDINFKVE